MRGYLLDKSFAGNMDQLSRTLRQVVDFLPRLQGRTSSSASSTGSAEALAADAAVSRRLDELEARIEARFDEVAGAIVARVEQQAGVAGSEPGSAVDLSGVRAQVREEMQQVTRNLADLGEHLRAELVTAAGQAEARLNRDRDQLRETLNQTMVLIGLPAACSPLLARCG